jgi:site-specific DNA recombinase
VPRRAGIYLRISEDRTGEGLAVDRQRQDCAALVRSRGWSSVGEYVDNDISAAGKRRRPAFEQLMADVEAQRIDTIVALSLDRLTRNRRDQLRLIETCQHHKVLVALVKGSDIDMTAAVGRAMADMMAVWARMEIEQKSERHRSQIQQAAKAGLPGGGPRAFGYRKGGMEIESAEADVVKELYHRFLAGAGLGELTDWINRTGFTTPKGFRWRSSSVRVVLGNPRNAGLRGLRPVVNEQTGLRAQWHDIIGPAQWPAIVDETVWRAAMQILTDPERVARSRNGHAGGAQPRHLLSGIARCGRCGLYMITSSSGGGKRIYKCASQMHLMRNAAHLENYVQMVLISWLRRPDAIGLLQQADESVDLDALRDEAVALRARLDGLARDYADGVLDRTQMRTASDRVRERLSSVDDQLAELGRVDILAPLVLADDEAATLAAWNGYPVPTRRAVVSRVMRIEVFRGRVGRPPAGAPFDPSSVRIEWIPRREL